MILVGVALGYPALGALLAVILVLEVITVLSRSRQRVTAWRVGAEGEQATARALEALPDGWVVIHDRRIPGGPANIDHVVVGPPGVFVVETKQWRGRVSIDGSTIRVNGRRRDVVTQVRREAEAVQRLLDDQGRSFVVRPLICVHGAELPLFRQRVDDIALVSGRGLVGTLTNGAEALGRDEIRAISNILDGGLRHA